MGRYYPKNSNYYLKLSKRNNYKEGQKIKNK